jgi:ribose 5-phosphate isomerase/pterin-4a-carbinolamine dehydratase
MCAFVPPLPLARRVVPLRRAAPLVARPRLRAPAACAAAAASGARAATLRAGVAAAVDDFVTSGSNIAIGGASCDAVAEALSVKFETGALTDVAFIATSPAARAAVARFALPTDTAVNHGAVDVFFACVNELDAELNAALAVGAQSVADGGGAGDATTDAAAAAAAAAADADAAEAAAALRTERMAAQLATQSVIVVPEADFEATASGITSFPIVLDPVFSHKVADAVRTDPVLRDLGVHDVTLRPGSAGRVADVLLRPASDVFSIDAMLSEMQGVHAVGLLLTSPTVTAVVACANEAYDITSSLGTIADLARSVHPTDAAADAAADLSSDLSAPPATPTKAALPRLTGTERSDALRQLGGSWAISTDGRDYIVREFRFGTVQQCHAFLSRMHRIARLTDSYPELTTVCVACRRLAAAPSALSRPHSHPPSHRANRRFPSIPSTSPLVRRRTTGSRCGSPRWTATASPSWTLQLHGNSEPFATCCTAAQRDARWRSERCFCFCP